MYAELKCHVLKFGAWAKGAQNGGGKGVCFVTGTMNSVFSL